MKLTQANQILKIENLDTLVDLEELYLAENKIEKIENLERLKKLRTLDLSFNYIQEVENLHENELLEELWLSHNKMADFKDFEKLKELKSLKTVYFELCPVARNPGYRQQVMDLVPTIKQIDHFRRDFNIQFKGAGIRIAKKKEEQPIEHQKDQ